VVILSGTNAGLHVKGGEAAYVQYVRKRTDAEALFREKSTTSKEALQIIRLAELAKDGTNHWVVQTSQLPKVQQSNT
jgi:hypothetical protein